MNSLSRCKFIGMKVLFSVMLLLIVVLTVPSEAHANEIMTDRCSGDVAFPHAYDGGPLSLGTFILTRQRAGATNWSFPFRVVTDGDGHIRWWCHSTTGNWFDPGTWRIDSASIGSKCDDNGCTPTADLSVQPPDSSTGWTAERSRCNSHSSVIRARLGDNRLLQIECLDGNTGTSSSGLTIKNCSFGPDTCIQGFVWREAIPSDHVCVDPSVRSQAQSDNAAAGRRRNPNGGAFGPDTCLQGYVWREAFSGDHVCVTSATRAQASFDNERMNARKACK
jgi:hypothetical protein